MYCFSLLPGIDICISNFDPINRCVNLRVYSIPRGIARSSYLASSIKCQGSGQLGGLPGSKYGLTNGAWLQNSATSFKGVGLVSKLVLNSFHAVNLSVPNKSNTVGHTIGNSTFYSSGHRVLIIQYHGVDATVFVVVF